MFPLNRLNSFNIELRTTDIERLINHFVSSEYTLDGNTIVDFIYIMVFLFSQKKEEHFKRKKQAK